MKFPSEDHRQRALDPGSNRTFYNDRILLKSVLSNMVATGHVWLLSTWNVASTAKEQNFKFDFNLFI